MWTQIKYVLVAALPLTVEAVKYGKAAPDAFRVPKSEAVDHVSP